MWRFEIQTGRFLDKDGVLRSSAAYSGFSKGKNNPNLQKLTGIGPIPVGIYKVGTPHESPEHLGHYVMDLLPCEGTETWGRDLFRVHGDSKEHPGMASHGCIILPRPVREAIWLSGDHFIEVVTGISPASEVLA